MMKKIVTIATIFAAFVLSGCATNKYNLPRSSNYAINHANISDSEKDAIKRGDLVKFTEEVKTGSKIMLPGKVYVCFTSSTSPTDSTACYPKLSAYIGKYLQDAGIDVAPSKTQADKVIYAQMRYAYIGVSSWHTEENYRALFDQTIEDSLAHGDQPQLSPETMDAIYKKDTALHKNIADQSRLETAGKVLVGLAAMAIGGVNGGLQASQAFTGITNPQNIEAPYGSKSGKDMMITLYDKDKPHEAIAHFDGIYSGPRDIFQSFGDLFPSAVKSTAELFAQNTTAKN